MGTIAKERGQGVVGGGVSGRNLLRGKGNSSLNPPNRILTEGRPG